MLQGRIGLSFAILAIIALVFNAFFDSSPQSLFNVCEDAAMAILFLSTCFKEGVVFKGIQLVSLLVAAFISFRLSETPLFGSVMIIFAVVLLYAYGGYRTFKGVWIFATMFTVFALSFLSIANFIPLSAETFTKAIAWSAFIAIFCFVLWLVVEDIERTFHLKMKQEIILNRAELESIKKEVGGCQDGHNP